MAQRRILTAGHRRALVALPDDEAVCRARLTSSTRTICGASPAVASRRTGWALRCSSAPCVFPDGFFSPAFMMALRAAKIIAPGPSTFERLCAAALVTAERRVQTRITGALSPAQQRSLQQLLELEPGERLTPLGALRRPHGGHGPNDLKALVGRVETLRAVAAPKTFEGVPALRLAQLARECERVSIAHLREMRHGRRMALLAAFVVERRAQITDEALDLGLRLTGALFKRAERRHLDALVDSRRSIGDVVRAHADLGQALLAAREAGVDLGEAIDAALGWDGLERSVEAAMHLRAPIAADVLERIEAEHPRLRRFGAALLATFTFHGGRDMADLLDALARLKNGPPTGDAPMAFVSPRWRKAINADGDFNAKVYEICVFATLRDALRAGDVWVEGSQRYQRFQDRLLAPAATLDAAKAGPVADILKRDAGGWISDRRQRLDALLGQAERQAATGALPDAAIRDGRLSVTPLRATTPDAARALARQIYDLLPRVRITDLLEEGDGWTGFGDHLCRTPCRRRSGSAGPSRPVFGS